MSIQKMIVFKLAEEEYCLDVLNVKSIERLLPITRVPQMPHFVKGVVNLRGVVTPVIDLRLRLDLPASPESDHTRMIIASTEDGEVGLIVDEANDVIDLPTDKIEPPYQVAGGVIEEYIKGVSQQDDRLFIILNLEKVLDREALASVEEEQ